MNRRLNVTEKLIFSLPFLLLMFWGGFWAYDHMKPFCVQFEGGWTGGGVRFSTEGDRVAVVEKKLFAKTGKYLPVNRILIRDAHNGRELVECADPTGPDTWLTAPVFFRKGKCLLSFSSAEFPIAGKIRKQPVSLVVWDASSGELLVNRPWDLKGETDRPLTQRVLADGKIVALGRQITFINPDSLKVERVWPWKSDKLAEFRLDSEQSVAATFDSDFGTLPGSRRNAAKLWKCPSASLIRTIPIPGIRYLRWSSEGDNFAILEKAKGMGRNAELGRLHIYGQQGRRLIWQPPFNDINQFAWSPSGTEIALQRTELSATSPHSDAPDENRQHLIRQSVEWWNVRTKNQIWSTPIPSPSLERLIISPDGKWLCGWGLVDPLLSQRPSVPDWVVWVWSTKDGSVQLEHRDGFPRAVQWSPIEPRLLLSGESRMEIIDFGNIGE